MILLDIKKPSCISIDNSVKKHQTSIVVLVFKKTFVRFSYDTMLLLFSKSLVIRKL